MAKPENLKRLTSTPAPAPGEVTEFSTAGLSTDTGRASRIGLWALAIGFGGFVLWAALAPLDEGVPAPGLVSIDTKRKTVQHLQGGLIKEVLVGEGTRVKEG
ncbi:MAG: secretion protein HlyD, partial [Burkholderiaceae bacterium]|nr:secretion protein HlyD [Burkholderiaceae bacterium]